MMNVVQFFKYLVGRERTNTLGLQLVGAHVTRTRAERLRPTVR